MMKPSSIMCNTLSPCARCSYIHPCSYCFFFCAGWLATCTCPSQQGGGKGTISNKIIQDFTPHFHHLSTGDVLRQHVREETEIGKQAHEHMRAGGLVPDELMVRLLDDAKENVSNEKGLLLDGFPRTIEQAATLDKSITVDLVINLDVPTETIVERISDR